jgi:starch-binding outer membrane protein, SusD/RagB family
MKNKFIKIYSSLIILVFTAISCDDLERFPTNGIDTLNSFKTIEDADAWKNGMYATFRGNVYGAYMFTTDVQSDLLNATTTYGNRNGAVHRWTDFLANTGILNTLWSSHYSAIKNINVMIAGLPTIPVADAAESTKIREYIGGAHLARAYYYHNLVTRFGKMYDPATANTDLGVPILTEFNVNAQESRKTVKEVYDLIIDDLTIARTNLSTVTGAAGSKTFNIDVVNALEARVKFYMQDFVGAKTIADRLINSGRYPLNTTANDIKNMWHSDNHQKEVILSMFYSAPQELGNTNNIYLGFVPNRTFWNPDFIPSQWVVDLYDNNDFRKNVYFNQLTVQDNNGNDYPNIWLVNKYPGNPDLFTTANTNYQHSAIVFRIAEMYMISAESALSIPGGDALTPLNALRRARNLANFSGTGPVLTQAVREERLRELAFEGLRLDDLRRWKLGFTRRDPQNAGTVLPGSEFTTLSVSANADKFTWGIPTNEITINANMQDQQNSGW